MAMALVQARLYAAAGQCMCGGAKEGVDNSIFQVTGTFRAHMVRCLIMLCIDDDGNVTYTSLMHDIYHLYLVEMKLYRSVQWFMSAS